MKIGRLFRRKRRGNRDDSTKDASNRGSVDDGHEPPPNHGSSEMANRGSSEFPSHVLNTTTPLPSISRRSNNRTETGSNGHRSQIPPAPPSPSMNDDTHASESEDVVSEMITTVGGKRRINKGVPDSFKGLTVSHRFNVPQVAEDPQAVRELSEAYDSIPEIEQIRLPRGGISIDTKAVGRIQVSIYDGIITPSCCRSTNFSIHSLESLLKPSRIACDLEFLFHKYTSFQLRDSVERWGLLLELTLRSLSFPDISIFLYADRNAQWL